MSAKKNCRNLISKIGINYWRAIHKLHGMKAILTLTNEFSRTLIQKNFCEVFGKRVYI